jgi:hypothetical protein
MAALLSAPAFDNALKATRLIGQATNIASATTLLIHFGARKNKRALAAFDTLAKRQLSRKQYRDLRPQLVDYPRNEFGFVLSLAN